MRKVFLDNLPKGGSSGVSYNQINWENSKKCIINFIYDDIKGTMTILDYNKTTKNLLIEYENDLYDIDIHIFKNGQLSRILGKRTSKFKVEIGTVFKDEKRNITIMDKEYRIRYDKNNKKRRDKWYKYNCNVCGWSEGWVLEGALLGQGVGCSCCAGKPILGINTIWDMDKWMIPIVGEEYAKTHTHGSSDEIYPVCPKCHHIQHKLVPIHRIYTNKTLSCEYCSDGIKYPNRFGYNLLEKLLGQRNFETEYSPRWIKPKRYDFYFKLNNKEYILEMDGWFHNNDNMMNGQTFYHSKHIDNYKDEQARLHGIKVIRIDCDYGCNDRFNFIKQNIIKDKTLNELFDLSQIDWNEINKNSQKSLMLDACLLKKNNFKLTTGEIKNMLGIKSNYIIQRYLETGSNLGLCTYSKEQEKLYASINNAKRLKKSRSKPIINLQDKTVWLSASQCEKESINFYGFKLNHNLISQVCIGNRNHHHNFKFKYIKDLTPDEYIEYDIENKLKELHNRELVQAC